MFIYRTLLISLTVLSASCSMSNNRKNAAGRMGEPGKNGESCTIAGTIISCGESRFDMAALEGSDGASCKVSSDETKIICGTTEVLLEKLRGATGAAGATGAKGQECSITGDTEATKKIVCGSASISMSELKGSTGAQGKGCAISNEKIVCESGSVPLNLLRGESCRIDSAARKIICGETSYPLDSLKGETGAKGLDGKGCSLTSDSLVCGDTKKSLNELRANPVIIVNQIEQTQCKTSQDFYNVYNMSDKTFYMCQGDVWSKIERFEAPSSLEGNWETNCTLIDSRVNKNGMFQVVSRRLSLSVRGNSASLSFNTYMKQKAEKILDIDADLCVSKLPYYTESRQYKITVDQAEGFVKLDDGTTRKFPSYLSYQVANDVDGNLKLNLGAVGWLFELNDVSDFRSVYDFSWPINREEIYPISRSTASFKLVK